MNRTKILLGSLALLAASTSCNDFLTLTPRDQKVVSSVEDYRDVMASFMYAIKTPENKLQTAAFGVDPYTIPFFTGAHGNLAIYTDEATLNINSGTYFDKRLGDYTQTGRNMLTWLMPNDNVWRQYYTFLGPVNLILSELPKATGTNEELRARVKGEALLWRAYSYFKLLQFYAPYGNAALGVPVYLTPQMEIGAVMPPRNTQAEVFAQIIGDCSEALELLTVASPTEWNFFWSRDFANAMLASIYQWKAGSAAGEASDWAMAEKHASAAIGMRRLASDAATLKAIFNCSTDLYAIPVTSDEIMVRITDGQATDICDLYSAYNQDGVSDGRITPSNTGLFATNDIRRAAWISNDIYNNKYSMVGESMECMGCLLPYRLADMVLTKAEAQCRQGNVAGAAETLAGFVACRYTGDIPAVPSEKEALLEAILMERRREFYQEADMRWFDMKRLGATLERVVGGEKHTLLPDDFRYAFPIPAREMRLNKNMVQNPGWESIILF